MRAALIFAVLLYANALVAAEPLLVQKQIFEMANYRTVAGATIATVKVGYESYGKLNQKRDNTILVAHYFSGSSHAAGKYQSNDSSSGYWDAIIGPGKAIDTDRYFVISVDTLVNLAAHDRSVVTTGPATIDTSTGKPYGLTFPVVQAADFVEVQKALLDSFGIDTLHAVIGPSGGSIQAMEWAARYPDKVARVIAVISPGFYLPPYTIAELETWAQPIRLDPLWQNGNYPADKPPLTGLALALRNVSHAALSFDWAEQQFGAAASRDVPVTHSLEHAFAIERELQQRGVARAAMVDANHFLYTVRAYQLYDVRSRIATMKAKFLFLPARTDRIFPPALVEEAAAILRSHNVPVTVQWLDGGMGHLDGIFHIDQAASSIRRHLQH